MPKLNRCFILIVLMIILSCKEKEVSELKNLKVISFSNTERYFKSNGSSDTKGMKMRIAFLKDMILYEVPSIKGIVKQKSYSDTIINEVQPGDTVYTYFVFRMNGNKGFKFSSVNDTAGTLVSQDSILLSIGLHKSQMQFYEVALPKPVAIIRDRQTKEIRKETYFYIKQDINDADSLYRFYDRSLLDIPFSLAPNIDREKKSKMWRMAFTNLPFFDKQTNKQVNRVEGNTEFRKIEIMDKAKIIALIKLAEKSL